jgi:hypothetical protein
METTFFDSSLFNYVFMTVFIFLARICDISIGAFRIIFVSEGKRKLEKGKRKIEKNRKHIT